MPIIKHEGLSTHRIKQNYLEGVMAERWADFCESGNLEYLLSPAGNEPAPITQRDATVAATVIQWLGSPVGRRFLRDCGFTSPNF